MSEKVNEYLVELVPPRASVLSIFSTTKTDHQKLIESQERRDNCSALMLSDVTSWLIKKDLTDSFKRAAAVSVPVEGKSWLLLVCTENLKDKVQQDFSSRVQNITKLSAPSTLG